LKYTSSSVMNMSFISENNKKRILSLVMDFIRAEGLKFIDDYPIRISRVYLSLIEESSELPNHETFIKKTGSIRTSFFKINPAITKKRFLEDLLHQLNRESKPILRGRRRIETTKGPSVTETLHKQVYIDEIDSFSRVRNVSPKAIEDIVPLKVSEEEIKASLANIIGEKFIPKDWGGEKSDLYSSHVIFKGRRISTAFLLKGPAVKRLTINKCGKRGNQVLRLVREPAELFAVQHIGEIDTDVIELLDICVSDLSRKKNMKLYFCVIDGVDTARILFAYEKLSGI